MKKIFRTITLSVLLLVAANASCADKCRSSFQPLSPVEAVKHFIENQKAESPRHKLTAAEVNKRNRAIEIIYLAHTGAPK